MAEELKVYLDHLLRRDSLRYQRPKQSLDYDRRQQLSNRLELKDLLDSATTGRARFLRKPDFQRSTWAWTPEDCVLLLESLVNGQVIPSIIMWPNEESGTDYVLDGGHRISVVLAWLRDEWDDKLVSRPDLDEEDEARIIRAAQEVRKLVKGRIGEISEFRAAEQELDKYIEIGTDARDKMGAKRFRQARFYQKLLKGEIAFHILWAEGDYQKAELSFLRINKSGRQLTDWETKLVENRNSSLARIVMSLTSMDSATHYWPANEQAELRDSAIMNKRQEILDNLHDLYEVLFKPTYQPEIRRLHQPLFAITTIPKKPYYLAELFTVIQDGKGYETETKKLLEADRDANPAEIIERGWKLIDDAVDDFTHLAGTGWKSLSIVPALYFYTESGKYIRSLLYGLIYWLLAGTNEEVLSRKRLFTLHRAAFERILMDNKEDVVSGIGRKIGSGPEITAQTAEYYHKVLELLIKYEDNIESAEFIAAYEQLSDDLIGSKRGLKSSSSTSSTFSPRQKSTKILQALLTSALRCELCGGILDPEMGVQHDHITQRFNDGKTTDDNQRIVHPFCNHEREVIDAVRKGQRRISLPAFVDSLLASTTKQMALPLVFFDDATFLSPYSE